MIPGDIRQPDRHAQPKGGRLQNRHIDSFVMPLDEFPFLPVPDGT